MDMRAAGGWRLVPGFVGRTDRPPGVAEREPGVPGWVRPAARARCREASCALPLAARLDPLEPSSAPVEAVAVSVTGSMLTRRAQGTRDANRSIC